jgi:hypothetical protein
MSREVSKSELLVECLEQMKITYHMLEKLESGHDYQATFQHFKMAALTAAKIMNENDVNIAAMIKDK